jgi:pyruvyltransferase
MSSVDANVLDGLRGFWRKNFRKPEVSPWPALAYPGIDVAYWHPKDSVNFGDELSRVVTTLLLAQKGYSPFDELKTEKQLLTIGSNIHFARDGAVVWGSGANISGARREYNFKSLDVRAVRGPLTAEFLQSKGINVPEVYGDPALLLPMLVKDRFSVTGEVPVAFVPNLNDNLSESLVSLNIPVISPLQSWNKCITEILKCKFIIASSLHALVIAEAWGIPARYVRLSEHEGVFKYSDYYGGTGRSDYLYANSIAEAIEMGGEKPLKYDSKPLLEAFPFDLWEQPL